MYRNPWCSTIVVAVLMLLRADGGSAAEAKKLTLDREWKGTVAEATLAKGAPDHLADQASLDKLWKAWGLAEKPPMVDFSKQIVVLATTSGSRLTLIPQLDANGDLKVLGLATRDFGPGFRYVIAAVDRTGIKTVNGKPVEAAK